MARSHSRPSKLDPVRDQILEWVRQGRDARWIAAKLGEMDIKVTHQAVSNFIKKALRPALARVQKKVKLALNSIDEAFDKALESFQVIERMKAEDFTFGHRDKFRLLGEWFDRMAKLKRLYPEGGVKTAVQVNVVQDRENLWNWLQQRKEPIEIPKA